AQHRQDLGVDRRLAAAELHHLRLALQRHETVEHALYLRQRQAEAGLGVGEADRALQVAVAVNLDQPQAGGLLVLRTESAVVRAAVAHLGAKAERNAPRLVVAQRGHVRLGVRAQQRLKPAVLRAALAHHDAAIAQQDLRIDGRAADRADAARQLK